MLDELLGNPAMLQVFTVDTNIKHLLQALWDIHLKETLEMLSPTYSPS